MQSNRAVACQGAVQWRVVSSRGRVGGSFGGSRHLYRSGLSKWSRQFPDQTGFGLLMPLIARSDLRKVTPGRQAAATGPSLLMPFTGGDNLCNERTRQNQSELLHSQLTATSRCQPLIETTSARVSAMIHQRFLDPQPRFH